MFVLVPLDTIWTRPVALPWCPNEIGFKVELRACISVPGRVAQEADRGSGPRQAGAGDGGAGREEEAHARDGVRAGQPRLRLHLLHAAAGSTGQAAPA